MLQVEFHIVVGLVFVRNSNLIIIRSSHRFHTLNVLLFLMAGILEILKHALLLLATLTPSSPAAAANFAVSVAL